MTNGENGRSERVTSYRKLALALGLGSQSQAHAFVREGVLPDKDSAGGWNVAECRRKLAEHRRGHVAAATKAEEWPLGLLATSEDAQDRRAAAVGLMVLRNINSSDSIDEIRAALRSDELGQEIEDAAKHLGDPVLTAFSRDERIRALRAWSKGVVGEECDEREPQDLFPPRSDTRKLELDPLREAQGQR
jgi:hypothetical protein